MSVQCFILPRNKSKPHLYFDLINQSKNLRITKTNTEIQIFNLDKLETNKKNIIINKNSVLAVKKKKSL